jgi:hypothetical protein
MRQYVRCFVFFVFSLSLVASCHSSSSAGDDSKGRSSLKGSRQAAHIHQNGKCLIPSQLAIYTLQLNNAVGKVGTTSTQTSFFDSKYTVKSSTHIDVHLLGLSVYKKASVDFSRGVYGPTFLQSQYFEHTESSGKHAKKYAVAKGNMDFPALILNLRRAFLLHKKVLHFRLQTKSDPAKAYTANISLSSLTTQKMSIPALSSKKILVKVLPIVNKKGDKIIFYFAQN